MGNTISRRTQRYRSKGGGHNDESSSQSVLSTAGDDRRPFSRSSRSSRGQQVGHCEDAVSCLSKTSHAPLLADDTHPPNNRPESIKLTSQAEDPVMQLPTDAHVPSQAIEEAPPRLPESIAIPDSLLSASTGTNELNLQPLSQRETDAAITEEPSSIEEASSALPETPTSSSAPTDNRPLSDGPSRTPITARRIFVQGTVSTLRDALPSSHSTAEASDPQSSVSIVTESPTLAQTPLSSQAPISDAQSSTSVHDTEDSTNASDSNSNDSGHSNANNSRNSRPVTPSEATQAVLIARLLTVAAASTAASLLPGEIHIDNQQVNPFPGIDSVEVLPDGDPAEPEYIRSARRSRSDVIRRTTSESETINSTRRYSRFFPGPRRALSALSSSVSGRGRSSADEDMANAPVIGTRFFLADNPIPSSSAPLGSFERFLNDLMSDVGVAIIQHAQGQNSPGQTAPQTSEASTQRNVELDLAEEEAAEEQSQISFQSDSSDTTVRSEASAGGEMNEEIRSLTQATSSVMEEESNRAQSSPPNMASSTFSFFRSFRFPNRQLSASGHLLSSTMSSTSSIGQPERNESIEVPEGSTTSTDSIMPGSLDQPVSHSLEHMHSNEPLPPDGQQTTNTANPPSNPLSVTPILFVGVRSMGAPSASFDPFSFFSSLLFPASADPPSSPSPETEDTPVNEQRSSIPEAQSESLPSSDLPSTEPGQYMMFFSAGFYPANSPFIHFPLLLSSLENASYEDFIRLAELIGNAAKTTVSKEQIEKAGLKIVPGSDVKQYHGDTAERCLICLNDYEASDSCRVLRCSHLFHQDCVDKWLETAKNSCPACRATAVELEI